AGALVWLSPTSLRIAMRLPTIPRRLIRSTSPTRLDRATPRKTIRGERMRGASPLAPRAGAAQAGARGAKQSGGYLLARPGVKSGFIAGQVAEFAVARMCRALEVSVSGPSAWRARRRAGPSAPERADALVSARIRSALVAGRGVSGSPRMPAAL